MALILRKVAHVKEPQDHTLGRGERVYFRYEVVDLDKDSILTGVFVDVYSRQAWDEITGPPTRWFVRLVIDTAEFCVDGEDTAKPSIGAALDEITRLAHRVAHGLSTRVNVPVLAPLR